MHRVLNVGAWFVFIFRSTGNIQLLTCRYTDYCIDTPVPLWNLQKFLPLKIHCDFPSNRAKYQYTQTICVCNIQRCICCQAELWYRVYYKESFRIEERKHMSFIQNFHQFMLVMGKLCGCGFYSRKSLMSFKVEISYFFGQNRSKENHL